MPTAAPTNRAPSHRTYSLAAGIIYLLTFVSIPTLSLYGAIHLPDYVTGAGPDTPAQIGVLLELIVALGCIGTAVALFPIVKRQNEAVAVGLLSARILEAATIFAGVACVLTIVGLRQAGAGESGAAIGSALAIMYDRIFLFGQSFMPAINDILLGSLLFASRLVPRGLSLIGLLGGILLIAGDMAVLFGLIGQHDPTTAMLSIPVALFEFVLGLLLTFRGFDARAAESLLARPER